MRRNIENINFIPSTLALWAKEELSYAVVQTWGVDA